MRWGLVLAALLSAARAEAKPERPRIAVLVDGDEPARAQVKQALGAAQAKGQPVDLDLVELPAAPPEPPAAPADLEARLAAARKLYAAEADFAGCLSKVAGDDLIPDLLFSGQRTLAARVLFWRVVCQERSGAKEAARRDAEAMATLGLEAPADVEAAPATAQDLLVAALLEVQKRPRRTLKVTADVAHGRLSIDGRDAGCAAPCTLDAAPGDHVLRLDADGVNPERLVARVDDTPRTAAFKTTPAPPELAAKQWTARYGSSPAADSSASARLLARAVRARRLVLVRVDKDARGARLRAVLVENGDVTGRAERQAKDPAGEATAVVHDVLVVGRVLEPPPPLYERPAFWLTAGGIAVGTAAAVFLILYQPPIETSVSFQ